MFRRRTPVILQSTRTECGLAALTMVGRYHGIEIDLPGVRYLSVGDGQSLSSLLSVAERMGLTPRPVRLELDDLAQLTLPAVLHWDFDHFVVLIKVTRRALRIHDPASGMRVVRHKEANARCTGVAIEFSRVADLPAHATKRLPLVRGLLRSFDGIGRYLAMMLLLLIAVQLIALAPPVVAQLLIDETLLGSNSGWRGRILVGLAAIMAAGLLLEAMRRWITIYAGSRLSVDCTGSVVRHLLGSPVAAVGARSVGDLLSRLESMRPVRVALTESGVNALVQTAVLLSTQALMFIYSPTLAWLSLAAVFAAQSINAAMMPATRAASLQALLGAAQASNTIIDSLQAHASSDMTGRQSRRLAQWRRAFANSTNAAARVATIQVGIYTGGGVIALIDYCLFLGIGIAKVSAGELTIGAVFALMALRGRLQGAAGALLLAVREFALLQTHIDRVADIVCLPGPPPAPAAACRRPLAGSLQCRGLEFAYPGRDPVVRNFNCQIEVGERVVISGPSGVGKSTLLMLLAGSLTPRSGQLAFDNMPIDLWDRRTLQNQFGAVLQGDRLFEGTVVDNITDFDPAPDLAQLREAAEIAMIWHDIMLLPMGARTPLSNNGGSLSGGQVQRLLLARALYRRPRILFLDEATSHLDAATESAVLDRIDEQSMTVVSVAHRAAYLRRGGREIRLGAASGDYSQE